MKLTIHTDGGARGNPGPAATGFIIVSDTNDVVAEGGSYLGENTNNVAEYQAVIDALNWIVASPTLTPPLETNFFLDSNLVVQQLNGKFKIKQAHLQTLAQKVHELVSAHSLRVSFSYVPREQNKAADAMVNQILDANTN